MRIAKRLHPERLPERIGVCGGDRDPPIGAAEFEFALVLDAAILALRAGLRLLLALGREEPERPHDPVNGHQIRTVDAQEQPAEIRLEVVQIAGQIDAPAVLQAGERPARPGREIDDPPERDDLAFPARQRRLGQPKPLDAGLDLLNHAGRLVVIRLLEAAVPVSFSSNALRNESVTALTTGSAIPSNQRSRAEDMRIARILVRLTI